MWQDINWTLVLDFALVAVVAYLLGGINGAIITSKYFYKKDIRNYGSGNAGLTNFYRVFGKYGLALVLAIDIMKTVVPVVFAGLLLQRYGMWLEGSAFAGFFAMLGHAYPVYYEFKGGKAVMAGGTLVWFVDWRVGIIVWSVFAIAVLLTRHVSLGSILAGLLYPVCMAVLGVDSAFVLIMVSLSGALLIYRHKDNIKRIINGTESKLTFRK